MTFKDAAAFVMPFGKHRGLPLDSIASTDKGLSYLDWLRGERAQPTLARRGTDLDEALAAYLDDKTIQAEVARAVERRGTH